MKEIKKYIFKVDYLKKYSNYIKVEAESETQARLKVYEFLLSNELNNNLYFRIKLMEER